MKIETIYLGKRDDITGSLQAKIFSSCVPNMVIPNVDPRGAAHFFYWLMQKSNTDWRQLLIGSDALGDEKARYLDVTNSTHLTHVASVGDFETFEQDLTAAMKEHGNDILQFIGGMVRYSDEMNSLLRHLEVTWFGDKIVIEVKTELQQDIMQNVYFFNTADVTEYETQLYKDITAALNRYCRP